MTSGHPFERFLIIGVDPGKACGFATLDAGVFGAGDLTWHEATIELERLLSRHRPNITTIVSVERYTFTQAASKMTRQYDALEFIGVARYLCLKHGVQLLIQGASEAQRLGTPDLLRRFGWWQKGLDHANKAGAQVAYAAARVDPVRFGTLLPSSRVDQTS